MHTYTYTECAVEACTRHATCQAMLLVAFRLHDVYNCTIAYRPYDCTIAYSF